MSERDFAMALAMLAEAFGEKGLTPVRIEAYHRSLHDVPLVVLNQAVTLAIRQAKYFPRVSELREWCEKARLELRGAIKMPDPLCDGCSSGGFTELREADNVIRMVRCSCWKMTQAKVEALGVGSVPLALPEADFSRMGE
jgi:hypothetical protein